MSKRTSLEFIDLTGQRFGRLTVRSLARRRYPAVWRCECDCGTVREIVGKSLLRGLSNSCGCWRRGRLAEAP
jgi:hypothetical protein